ncbi:MAG: CehA/McbA family metallohydrolase [Eubacterium sp.]|nr:CehA/McbA family metallohydrolase [Eubacterium sp.]
MMNYIPCELHCHTIHSDGDFTPETLQQAAVVNELSLIALTDHNTLSGTKELNGNIIPFVKGIEWTTYFGHMLVLGAKEFVDWRDAVPNNIDEKIEAVRKTGATVGVAHPFQCGSPICTGGRWEFNVSKWENVNYIEIWHEAFHDGNTENDRAFAFWTSLLDKGYHLAASYGKDWHRPQNEKDLFGCTYLGIDGEINEENAVKAIKDGRMIVSIGAKISFSVLQNNNVYNIGETFSGGIAQFDFNCDFDARKNHCGNKKIAYQTIKIVTNGNETVCDVDKNTKSIQIELQKNHWYRAELWGTIDGKEQPLAVTSPVYVK